MRSIRIMGPPIRQKGKKSASAPWGPPSGGPNRKLCTCALASQRADASDNNCTHGFNQRDSANQLGPEVGNYGLVHIGPTRYKPAMR